jgi:hypothetical protein
MGELSVVDNVARGAIGTNPPPPGARGRALLSRARARDPPGGDLSGARRRAWRSCARSTRPDLVLADRPPRSTSTTAAHHRRARDYAAAGALALVATHDERLLPLSTVLRRGATGGSRLGPLRRGAARSGRKNPEKPRRLCYVSTFLGINVSNCRLWICA